MEHSERERLMKEVSGLVKKLKSLSGDTPVERSLMEAVSVLMEISLATLEELGKVKGRLNEIDRRTKVDE